MPNPKVKKKPKTTQLHRPKAVLFDWDNTLVDSWPTIHAAMNKTFEEWNMPPWSLEETKARVRHSMRDAFPALFGDDWAKAGERYRANYLKYHIENLNPLEDAEALIKMLAESGVYVGVISNKLGLILRREAEQIGWMPLLGGLMGSGDAEADKPSPIPVHTMLKDARIEPGKDVWFVGDTVVDLECARASGIQPVFYGNRFDYEGGKVVLKEGEHHAPTHRSLIDMLKELL